MRRGNGKRWGWGYKVEYEGVGHGMMAGGGKLGGGGGRWDPAFHLPPITFDHYSQPFRSIKPTLGCTKLNKQQNIIIHYSIMYM